MIEKLKNWSWALCSALLAVVYFLLYRNKTLTQEVEVATEGRVADKKEVAIEIEEARVDEKASDTVVAYEQLRAEWIKNNPHGAFNLADHPELRYGAGQQDEADPTPRSSNR